MTKASLYKCFAILSLLFCIQVHPTETCFFIPPKGWEIADPKKLSPSVHICFIDKKAKGVPPSVNLATEATSVSLDAYVEAVRKIHAADPNAKWRDLGSFRAPLGTGRLTELELSTEFGKARLVQLIIMKNQRAYILTASALKTEFSKYYKTFDQVLHSLQSTTDLVKSYPKERLLLLEEAISSLTKDLDWKDFEKKIINDFTEMGPYWQILVLNEMHSKLLTTSE